MHYKFFTGVFFFIILAIPLSSVHAYTSDPFDIVQNSSLFQGAQQMQQQQQQQQLQNQLQGLQNQVQGLQNQVQGLQPQKPPVVLQSVVIPQGAPTDAFTSACVADPSNCMAQKAARAQCIQGKGSWAYSYGTGTLNDWPSGHCQCGTGYQWINNYACVPSTPINAVDPICPGELVSNGVTCEACPSGYHKHSNGSCDINVPTTTSTKKSNSHGLAANQIAAILSLLQAFGADKSVIASVQVALGQ